MTLLPPLPLLIKEKVEFYYYRQIWLEKIKIIHNQYKKTFFLHFTCTGKIELRGCGMRKNSNGYPMGSSSFITLVFPHHIIDHKKWIVNFKNDKLNYYPRYNYQEPPKVPLKYQYSSGLNDPNGYK
ncbi:MAG: hypothetical protein WD512_14260 [Candidatus Paceibacterota bacterium]